MNEPKRTLIFLSSLGYPALALGVCLLFSWSAHPQIYWQEYLMLVAGAVLASSFFDFSMYRHCLASATLAQKDRWTRTITRFPGGSYLYFFRHFLREQRTTGAAEPQETAQTASENATQTGTTGKLSQLKLFLLYNPLRFLAAPLEAYMVLTIILCAVMVYV